MISFRFVRAGVHTIIVTGGLATLVLQAQVPSPPTGGVLISGSSTAMDGKDLSVARRRFEAGARSYWHSHDAGQLLHVENGRMWTQKRGEGKRELGTGESDYAGPGVVHWHGATATSHLIQVNVGFGGETRWLEPVSDAEYRK